MNARPVHIPLTCLVTLALLGAERPTRGDEPQASTGSPPAYQRRGNWHAGPAPGGGPYSGSYPRHGYHVPARVSPPARGSTFQRPYPYHLDYYRKQYGGDYSPYFGFLYGTPQVFAPQSGYAPFYGGGYGVGPYGGGVAGPGGYYPGGYPGVGYSGGQPPFPTSPPAVPPYIAPAPQGAPLQPAPPATAAPPPPSATGPINGTPAQPTQE